MTVRTPGTGPAIASAQAVWTAQWGVAAGSHPKLRIAALTAAEACEIFVGQYWAPIGADELPTGFDHCVSDDSYNAGPRSAAVRLKRIDLLRLSDPAAKIHAYSKSRLAFLLALKTRKIFGAGWARRVAGVEAESLRMAYKDQGEARAPSPVRGASTPTAPLYPTPLDIPKRRPAQPITPDAIAAEAAKASAARTSAQKATVSGAAGAGATLPAVGHIHWAIWTACGCLALAALAVSLWRWRAEGARTAALANLAAELRGTAHVKSCWTSIAGQLARFGAPVLGGILGGPARGAVGTLVGAALGSALGVPATPQAVAAAIAADPAGASSRIGAVEAAHAGAMSELEAQIADVANARGQTIALARDGSQIAWGAPAVSTIITAGFLAITAYAVVRGVADNPVTQMLVGTFAAAFGPWRSTGSAQAPDRTRRTQQFPPRCKTS